MKSEDNMINIREMTTQDIPSVVSFLDNTDEDFMNQWGGGRWYKYPVTVRQMTENFNIRRETTRYFVITDDEKIIGSAELDFIDYTKRECAVCRFLIAEQYRGHGNGTKALEAIVKYAFETLDMAKVYLSVFDFNIGAIKCYKKVGFVKCGEECRDDGWTAIRMEKYNLED